MGVHHRRGSALIASLIAVTAIAILGAGLVQVAAHQMRRAGQSTDRKRALYLAETGISEAWFAVTQGKSGNVGSPEEPAAFANGVYWVEATWLPQDQIALSATGLVGAGRFAIDIVVQRPIGPFGDLGVFGDAALLVEPETVVDGWDSAAGEWIPAGARGKGQEFPVRVRSNGDVEARGAGAKAGSGGTSIMGDFQPGPEGVAKVEPGVTITGTTAPLNEPFELPPVDVPPVDREPARVFSFNRSIEHGRFGYESVTVPAGVTLTLSGPLELVVGELVVEPTGGIIVDGSEGPVVIYVDGPVHMPAGTGLETEGGTAADAALFLLEDADQDPSAGTPQPLDFAPTGELHALVYAPGAYLIVPPSLRLFGGVAAGRLELAPGCAVTFDVESERSPIGSAGLPKLVSWQVVELPDVPLVSRRVDPLLQLALDGVTPVVSNAAHLEYQIDLSYLDLNGFQKAYSGDVRAFDWSTVGVLLSMSWTDGPIVQPVQPPLALNDLIAAQAGGADLEAKADLLDGTTSTELRDKLLAGSPLSDADLYDVVTTQPPMESSDVADVLIANAPVPDKILIAAMDPTSPLTSSDLAEVLIECSPLSSSVLTQVNSLKAPRLQTWDKADVLAVQVGGAGGKAAEIDD